MIKICKKKAEERWAKIGKVLWYGWSISFFFSLGYFIYGLFQIPSVPFTLLVLSLTNTVFSGMFTFVFSEMNIISIIREKQKLFGWDEDC